MIEFLMVLSNTQNTKVPGNVLSHTTAPKISGSEALLESTPPSTSSITTVSEEMPAWSLVDLALHGPS
jgi:hypothetical protein